MPKARFDLIYKDLKKGFLNGIYKYQEMLPSESTMMEKYSCSRSTIRRAFLELINDGYIQSVPKKGYRVIYMPFKKHVFSTGILTTFQESLQGTDFIPETKILDFALKKIDEKMSLETGFPFGTEIWYIKRLRSVNGVPVHVDINLLKKELIPHLSISIATDSIYNYIENELKMTVTSAKCEITMQVCDTDDIQYLGLNKSSFVAVVKSQVFNNDGIQFEYTRSHHHPNYFCFQETAYRRKFE